MENWAILLLPNEGLPFVWKIQFNAIEEVVGRAQIFKKPTQITCKIEFYRADFQQ